MIKKIFKGLLYLIALLMAIFLLAGLVVPSVKFETEVTVDLGLSETWEKYNDLESLSEWIPQVKSVTSIKETEDKVGSIYEMEIENQGKTMTMTELITEFEENEKLAFEFNGGGMKKYDQSFFSGDSVQTTIKNLHQCVGASYFHKCLFAFFKSFFKEMDQQSLNQFKAWAEET